MNSKICLAGLILLLVTGFNALAAHSHDNRHGSHGMVIVPGAGDGLLLASHLPLHARPHDYQIIYRISIEQPGRLYPALQAGLVTLLPAPFDLSTLVEGRRLTVNARFYRGHFERGGELLFEAPLTFERPVLVEQLVPWKGDSAVFHSIALSPTRTLLVHKIQSSPSFDAIGWRNHAPMTNADPAPVVCKKPQVIEQRALQGYLEACIRGDLVYLETRDFQL